VEHLVLQCQAIPRSHLVVQLVVTSKAFVLQLTGNGSTVTWPSSVKWAGGTAPDAPASGETDILVFHTRDGGTNWYGVLASDAAA
jgi:hypothetical protein